MLDNETIKKTILEFDERFGRGEKPSLFFAPGRVNIIGDHTDYNGGFVLPMAIQLGTYMLIRKSELAPARLYSKNLNDETRFHPGKIKKQADWADYVRGVFLIAKETCGELPSFDAIFFGDLPLSAGLSSSASIELVIATGLQALGCNISNSQAVKIARRAENEFVGVSCGIMDQFTVAYGQKEHAILLNCETLEFRHVRFNAKACSLVVIDTGARRSLVESAYNERRRECEHALEILEEKIGPRGCLSRIKPKEFEEYKWALPEAEKKRAEHVIYESLRVEEAARCLEKGDARTLGYLMNRSHESLRDLFEVSSLELNAIQKISLTQPGVLGCRMTGAGFGGCMIALVENEHLEKYMRRLPNLYWKETHCEAELIVVSACDGARKCEEI
ncbi:MAG: galactokinase [Actinomycetota bacterium]|nr:galactokinase [Actinomycetota bacterium]